MLSVDKIEALFGSDEAIGVMMEVNFGEEVLSIKEYDEKYGHLGKGNGPDAASLMPDGTSAVCCTNYAHHVRKVMGDMGCEVDVVGFANEDNPTSRCAIEGFHPEGHDFAIVNDRYLIDPWVRLVAAVEGQIFYDLNDPADAAKANDIYGQRHLWLPLNNDGDDHANKEKVMNTSMDTGGGSTPPDHMSPKIGDIYYIGDLPIGITKVNAEIDPDHSGYIVFDNGMETSRLNLGMGCIRKSPSKNLALEDDADTTELLSHLKEHPEIHIDQARDGKWNFRHDDNAAGPDAEYGRRGSFSTREEAIRAAFDEYGIEVEEMSAARP